MKTARNRVKGFTLIEVMLFVALVTAPFVMWAGETYVREETAEILKNSANGAERAYWSRSVREHHALRLSAEVHDSRAPGHYQKVVELWLQASEAPDAMYSEKPKPAWLFRLESDEQMAVMKLLKEMNVTRDELTRLTTKLEAISPQLTQAETFTLQSIADFSAAQKLEDLQKATIRRLRSQLIELGASKGGLDLNHIKDPAP
jgi:hypothetical protein